MRFVGAAALLGLCLVLSVSVRAQTRTGALSDGEIEKIRESRLVPSESIQLFLKFLDARTDRISAMYAKPRRPGREQDTHDLLEQFTAIADELDDNLADYATRHADLRSALPKLLQATERWATVIKSPAENDAYAVSRKIALESVRDLKETATQMATDQEAWFKEHPPGKEKDQRRESDVITIPR